MSTRAACCHPSRRQRERTSHQDLGLHLTRDRGRRPVQLPSACPPYVRPSPAPSRTSRGRRPRVPGRPGRRSRIAVRSSATASPARPRVAQHDPPRLVGDRELARIAGRRRRPPRRGPTPAPDPRAPARAGRSWSPHAFTGPVPGTTLTRAHGRVGPPRQESPMTDPNEHPRGLLSWLRNLFRPKRPPTSRSDQPGRRDAAGPARGDPAGLRREGRGRLRAGQGRLPTPTTSTGPATPWSAPRAPTSCAGFFERAPGRLPRRPATPWASRSTGCSSTSCRRGSPDGEDRHARHARRDRPRARRRRRRPGPHPVRRRQPGKACPATEPELPPTERRPATRAEQGRRRREGRAGLGRRHRLVPRRRHGHGQPVARRRASTATSRPSTRRTSTRTPGTARSSPASSGAWPPPPRSRSRGSSPRAGRSTSPRSPRSSTRRCATRTSRS